MSKELYRVSGDPRGVCRTNNLNTVAQSGTGTVATAVHRLKLIRSMLRLCLKEFAIFEFAIFVLQKLWNRGIFKHLLTKGRPHWRILKTQR